MKPTVPSWVRAHRGGTAAGLGVLGLVVVLCAIAVFGGTTRAPSGQAVPSDPLPTPSTAQLRSLLAQTEPVVISVLGDSTGNDSTEWVALWAAHLGATRQVSLYQWVAEQQSFASQPLRLGDHGGKVTIFNASQPGAQANYPLGIIDNVQPARPDLVIYNFGHNNRADDIGPQLDALDGAITQAWGAEIPTAVTLQNPALGDRKARQEATLTVAQHWAANNRTPTIDVTAAFARGDLKALMADEVHPNAAGSRLWARTVATALG